MKPDTRSFYALAVQAAIDRIAADLDGALDLQALARAAALSPFHFHRVFRGMTGETPLELHRRLRMERAARQLRDTDLAVTHIAFTAGYETHESFTRAFRTHYACSPSDFRQSSAAPGASCARPFQTEIASRSGIHFPVQSAGGSKTQFVAGEETMEVIVKTMPELRLATVAHVGPYDRISEAFARLGAMAGPAGLIGKDSAMLALYHDDPETTPASELRSDAGVTIAPHAALPQGLGEQRLPAGRYACATHVGSYERLGDSWARLMGEWLPRSGQRMKDAPSYELYRNTPENAPEDELVTELYIPLADDR